MKKQQKKDGIFKYIVREIRDSILFEIISGIVLFIPRLFIRMLSHWF